jgi:hypothetical protein
MKKNSQNYIPDETAIDIVADGNTPTVGPHAIGGNASSNPTTNTYHNQFAVDHIKQVSSLAENGMTNLVKVPQSLPITKDFTS